jgi:hypothetical protein
MDERLRSALEHRDAGRYSEAEAILAGLRDEAPGSARVRRELGLLDHVPGR